MAEVQKLYFTYDDVHKSIKRVSALAKDFAPDFLIAISGGGLIPARMLRPHVNSVPILSVNIKFYDDAINKPLDEPKIVQWLDEENREAIKGKKIMIVDEVDDTRSTLSKCVTKLMELEPAEVAVFIVHNKLKPKKANLPNNVLYIATESLPDIWINYPWECDDIDEHNKLAEKKNLLYENYE